jgi:hypothetical protein
MAASSGPSSDTDPGSFLPCPTPHPTLPHKGGGLSSGSLPPCGGGLGWADENSHFLGAFPVDHGNRSCCAVYRFGRIVPFRGRRTRMGGPTGTSQHDKPSAYTTSKQVQAWFLGRSRDLWKKKYAELKVESKRLKQHVADACRSRADWRDKAEAAQREVQALQLQIAELQAQRDVPRDEAEKKSDRASRPR